MKWIPIIFSLAFLLADKSVCSQSTSYSDSIDHLIKKTFKGKSSKVTDMIDDSTGRTFEIYQNSKSPLLACLKLQRDSTTIEKHFYFIGNKLLKVSISTWNWRHKNVSFDSYYYSNGILKLLNIAPVQGELAKQILEISNQLYQRSRLIQK